MLILIFNIILFKQDNMFLTKKTIYSIENALLGGIIFLG